MIETETPKKNKSQIRRLDLVAVILVSLTFGLLVATAYWNRESHVVDAFHRTYYNDPGHTWMGMHWLGTPIQKFPMDTWSYQEILWEKRPDVLLEMGTADGGSARYFASIFDLIGNGRVITVDIQRSPKCPPHPRITYLTGSSTSDAIVSQIRSLVHPGERVMAVLDSDHRKFHVLNELRIYSQMVTSGQYLVVEDTDINGHPILPGWGEGPFEALAEFMQTNHDYVPDPSRERFKVTASPGGWLRRVR
jgi:cephalosporin hydroxylase